MKENKFYQIVIKSKSELRIKNIVYFMKLDPINKYLYFFIEVLTPLLVKLLTKYVGMSNLNEEV